MFKNIIRTAFRSLRRNSNFTIINISGLTIGLAACLLITFYVIDERSYDRYNVKADRIFRINSDLKFNTTVTSRAIISPVVASLLKNNYPRGRRDGKIIKDESPL